MTPDTSHPPASTLPGESRPVRGPLLHKLCNEEGLFALGASVARVIELASSDDEGSHSLAYYVLADAALTQKMLRLANTPVYRTTGGAPVTTVSRAITLLGFDNVKATALAMLLVDALDNSGHARSVRIELEAALCASLFGRELARLSSYQGAEEVSIAALFKNIGPLLIASREHARFTEIDEIMAGGGHTLGQASQMILGCSFDTLSAAVLREWKIPDVIVRSLSTLAPGPQKEAVNRQEWMRQVASFSLEAARLLVAGKAPDSSADGVALLARFGGALGLQQAQMPALFATVRSELQSRMESMGLAAVTLQKRAAAPAAGAVSGLPDALALVTMAAEAAPDGCHASGKPVNAPALLLAGVQQVSGQVAQMRAAGTVRVNEIILQVLETLYRGLGFRFATVCLKDPKSGQYRSRLALGELQTERQAGFVFPLASDNTLFHLAMANNADLIIADAAAPTIRDLLPAWHRALLPDTRSLMVLPLVLQSAQIGFFYADRAVPAPEGVPPEEAALVRALKDQVLAALAA